MQTAKRKNFRSSSLGFLAAGLFISISSPLNASEIAENHIEFSAGRASVDGDKPTFRANSGLKEDGFGGIESMRFSDQINEDWQFIFTGKAVAGNEDYAAYLTFKNEEVATIRFGYESRRSFSAGYGVAFPPDFFIVPMDPNLSLDRTKFLVEFQLHRPDAPVFTLRYTRTTRDGQKASTIYGDTTLTGSQRNIVPSIYDLDETRDVVEARVVKAGETTQWSASLVYEQTDNDDKVIAVRRPGESAERYQVSRNGTDNDIFTATGSVQTRVSEQLTLLSSALWTSLNGKINADRIYGATIDPVFDPNFPNRQARDHGVLDLIGDSNIRQFVGTIGALYQPNPNWAIVPSMRFERMYQDVFTDFTETSVGTSASRPVSLSEDELFSNKDYNSISSQLDVRYTGVKRWTFSGSIQYVYGDGNLEEELFGHDATGPVLSLERDTDYERTRFQIKGGAHWQASQAVKVSFGGYHRSHSNDFDHSRNAGGVTGGDRFPAYFSKQKFKVDDLNMRVSWRIRPNLSSITRFDYQLATIDTEAANGLSVRSGRTERTILSQSFSWQPVARLALQAGVNIVEDSLRTPPNATPGLASANIVVPDSQDYLAFHLTGFYAIDANTDLMLVYNGTFSDNWYDNSASGLPLGTNAEENSILTTVTHRMSENVTVSLQYGLYTYRDRLSAFKQDYTAHVVATRLYYRF